jgi:hypothetical protein
MQAVRGRPRESKARFRTLGEATPRPVWQASSPSSIQVAKLSNFREAQRSQEREC